LIFPLAVQALEEARAQFPLFSCWSWRISFIISLTILHKMTVIFRFVQSITFDALRPLDPTRESSMTPLPAILALQYTRVHICTTHSGNESSYVEAPINKSFCFGTTLDIPNIDPNYCHI